jgi:hypothetical protein
MNKRLTIHVKGVKAVKEPRKNKAGEMVEVPIIRNTLAFIVKSEDQINTILGEIGKKYEVTKHYLSNVN